MGKLNKIKKVIVIILMVLLLMACVDFVKVSIFHDKPVFTILINGYDDGGSGTYMGLWYRIDIMGNFMEFDEIEGVMSADYYILGFKLYTYKR